MKNNVIHLLTARHIISDILPPKNLQRSFWNALIKRPHRISVKIAFIHPHINI